MDQINKEASLNRARENLEKIINQIDEKLLQTDLKLREMKDKLSKLPPGEILVQQQLQRQFHKKAQELVNLKPSPYFIKCEIKFDNELESRIFYFSKFSLPEINIYSWTSPAAALRFESPGEFSYSVQNQEPKTGILNEKEQYLIANGKIVFMSLEGIAQPRELVYQEYFSQQKKRVYVA